MGTVQSIPGIGEIATFSQFALKLVGAVTCAQCDFEAYEVLFAGAVDSWVEYSEINVIAARINAAMKRSNGRNTEADRIIRKSNGAVESLINGIPVVGHLKGLFHYMAGNTDHGNTCMFHASRPIVVLWAGMVPGTLGTRALAGGIAGLLAGLVYDGTATFIKGQPTGIVQAIAKVADTFNANDQVDLCLAFVGDFYSGYSGAKIGHSFKAVYEKYAIEKAYQSFKDSGNYKFDPKHATTDTIDAARVMEKHVKSRTFSSDKFVSTRVRNIKMNHVSQGYQMIKSSEMSNGKLLERGIYGFKLLEDANQIQGLRLSEHRVIPIGAVNVNVCAERYVFNNYLRQPGASPADAQTVSVEFRHGSYRTVKRCANCRENNMGIVPTDSASGMSVPIADTTASFVRPRLVMSLLKATPKEKKDKKRIREE